MDVLRSVQIIALSAGALWATVQIYNWVDGKRKRLHAQISFSDLRWSPKLVKAFGFLRTVRYEPVLTRMFSFDESTIETRAVLTKLSEGLAAQAKAAFPEEPLLSALNLTSVLLTNTSQIALKSVRVAVPQAYESWIVTADKQIIESDNPPVAVLPSLPPKAVAEIHFLTWIKMWPHQAPEISITHDGGVAKRTVIDPVAKHPFLVSRDFKVFRQVVTMLLLGAGIAILIATPLLVWLTRCLTPLLKPVRP